MAISTTRRERVLLGLTVGVAVLWLSYHLGLKDVVSSLQRNHEDLQQAQLNYEDYIDYVEGKEARVMREFAKLEKSYGMGEQDQKEFTAQTERTLKAYGLMGLRMDPPDHEPIEGLEDYGYLNLTLGCDGDTTQIAQLLTYFDQRAILVRELKLAGKVDSPIIHADVTISQLIKLDEELKEKMKQMEKTRGLGSGQPRRRLGPGL